MKNIIYCPLVPDVDSNATVEPVDSATSKDMVNHTELSSELSPEAATPSNANSHVNNSSHAGNN